MDINTVKERDFVFSGLMNWGEFKKVLVILSEPQKAGNEQLASILIACDFRIDQNQTCFSKSEVDIIDISQLDGNPAKAITDYVKINFIDLIVIKNGFRNIAETGWKVLQRTKTALLVIKSRGPDFRNPRPWKKIMVPLDGTEGGETAIPVAEAFAKRWGSQLILFHSIAPVYNWGLGHPSSLLGPFGNSERREVEALAYLNGLAEEISGRGLTVSTKVVFGRPAGKINEYSDKTDVNLIAMSTRKRSGIDRWFSESITEIVLKYGNKTVLILKPGI
jgi:nucleotide-binding universal stress UspA family protein